MQLTPGRRCILIYRKRAGAELRRRREQPHVDCKYISSESLCAAQKQAQTDTPTGCEQHQQHRRHLFSANPPQPPRRIWSHSSSLNSKCNPLMVIYKIQPMALCWKAWGRGFVLIFIIKSLFLETAKGTTDTNVLNSADRRRTTYSSRNKAENKPEVNNSPRPLGPFNSMQNACFH